MPNSVATIYAEYDPNGRDSLRNAPIEAALVGCWLQDRRDVRVGEALVTEQRLLEQLDHAEIWHFSAHGEFNADAPMDSRIVLGQSQI